MEMDTKQQINSSALKWLFEMEALDSPVLLQNLYENVFLSHQGIKDCKIFITPPQTGQKGILVWLKLKFWTRVFHKEEAYSVAEQVIKTLLPSFRVRIVDDEKLLYLAVEKLKEVYGGGDVPNKSTDISNTTNNDKSLNRECAEPSIPENNTSDILPDSKESSKDKPKICNEGKQCDLPGNKKA